MKQFISHQQYQELDEDLRIEWSWIILRHMIEHFDKKEIKNVDYEDIHRHTTIGQMIEFINSKNYFYGFHGMCLSDNICDILWGIVKNILKEQK